jgi:hypothetical protein
MVQCIPVAHLRVPPYFGDLSFPGELPQNCKEVKRLNGAREDGVYFLTVRGKLLKVNAT